MKAKQIEGREKKKEKLTQVDKGRSISTLGEKGECQTTRAAKPPPAAPPTSLAAFSKWEKNKKELRSCLYTNGRIGARKACVLNHFTAVKRLKKGK